MIVFLCFLLFGVLMVFCLLAWRYASQRDGAQRESIKWQLEKSRRIASGWRPSLMDEE